MTREEAWRRISELNEPYKLEILDAIATEPITLYHVGDKWWDLCAGPHVESTGKLNASALSLETASGAMALQPPDADGFATWVLGLNAAFHAASCAQAAAAGDPGSWAVGKAELEAAAIGLPWHPAVFLTSRAAAGVLGGAAVQHPPARRGGGSSLLDAL